jgi:hypothetical protein
MQLDERFRRKCRSFGVSKMVCKKRASSGLPQLGAILEGHQHRRLVGVLVGHLEASPGSAKAATRAPM